LSASSLTAKASKEIVTSTRHARASFLTLFCPCSTVQVGRSQQKLNVGSHTKDLGSTSRRACARGGDSIRAEMLWQSNSLSPQRKRHGLTISIEHCPSATLTVTVSHHLWSS